MTFCQLMTDRKEGKIDNTLKTGHRLGADKNVQGTPEGLCSLLPHTSAGGAVCGQGSCDPALVCFGHLHCQSMASSVAVVMYVQQPLKVSQENVDDVNQAPITLSRNNSNQTLAMMWRNSSGVSCFTCLVWHVGKQQV